MTKALSSARRVRATVEKPYVLRKLAATGSSEREIPPNAILFWTPEAGIRLHLDAMVVLARSLQQQGAAIVFVRCFEGFARCPVMDMYQLPTPSPPRAREQVCSACLVHSVHGLPTDLPVIALDGLLTVRRRQEIRLALAAAPQDLRTFVFEGIAFGTLALHDLALRNKWSEFDDLGSEERAEWLTYIESCLTAFAAIDQVCATNTIRRLVYFNDYAVMTSARIAASRHGVEATTITQPTHANIERQRIQVMPMVSSQFRTAALSAWPEWRDLALGADQVRAGADDLAMKLLNSGVQAHIYSAAMSSNLASLFDGLDLARDRRTLVAYTNSLDEENAMAAYMQALGLSRSLSDQPFSDQIDWLSAVIDQVEHSPDQQLVIRVHPREGVTKREKTASQHLVRLRAAFDRPYQHVRVIWPEDQTSSYDLAAIAHAALVAWSSIGVELARMGLPVLASTQGVGPFPVDNFVATYSNRTAYLSALAALSSSAQTFDDVRRAYRWYWFQALGGSLPVDDAMTRSGRRRRPFPRSMREGPALMAAVLDNRSARSENLGRSIAAQGAPSRIESSALVGQLKRLVVVAGLGHDPGDASDLMVTTGAVRPDARSLLVSEGDDVRLRYDDRSRDGYAPLLARLGRLLLDAQLKD